MNSKAKKILNSAMNLLARDGIKKTTMDEIAAYSSASKVTIYKYFKDKDTFFLEIGRHCFLLYTNKLEALSLSDAPLQLKFYEFLDILSEFSKSGLFKLCLDLVRSNPELDNVFSLYQRTYRRVLENLIDEGLKQGLLKDTLRKEAIFHYINMGVSYFQYDAQYRELILNDADFKNKFMSFYIDNIFQPGSLLIDTGKELP